MPGSGYQNPAGAAGAVTKLFSQVLAVDTATLDTLANGIPGGYSALDVFLMLRTDEATTTSTCTWTINGDGGANYDRQILQGSSATANAAANVAATAGNIYAHGASGTAAYPSIARLWIPGYAATTFNKVISHVLGQGDGTAATNFAVVWSTGWRSTVAINQLTFTAPGGQKFKAGSTLIVYGIT